MVADIHEAGRATQRPEVEQDVAAGEILGEAHPAAVGRRRLERDRAEPHLRGGTIESVGRRCQPKFAAVGPQAVDAVVAPAQPHEFAHTVPQRRIAIRKNDLRRIGVVVPDIGLHRHGIPPAGHRRLAGAALGAIQQHVGVPASRIDIGQIRQDDAPAAVAFDVDGRHLHGDGIRTEIAHRFVRQVAVAVRIEQVGRMPLGRHARRHGDHATDRTGGTGGRIEAPNVEIAHAELFVGKPLPIALVEQLRKIGCRIVDGRIAPRVGHAPHDGIECIPRPVRVGFHVDGHFPAERKRAFFQTEHLLRRRAAAGQRQNAEQRPQVERFHFRMVSVFVKRR